MSRDLFQGKCLVGSDGYRWMKIYDEMPQPIRLRLQSSNHNICAACLEGEYHKIYPGYATNNEHAWHIAIDHIEAAIEHPLD